jgi:hypothetical protein
VIGAGERVSASAKSPRDFQIFYLFGALNFVAQSHSGTRPATAPTAAKGRVWAGRVLT